ncbi:MAG: hypothetical protein J5726_10215 [Treponema sp.]|nr:hypothetical protein [Treponema sp.]
MADSNTKPGAVSQALDDFAKKFARFAAAPQAHEGLKVESPLKSLQDQINQRESERASVLRRQFLEYVSPLTSDIEDDEEALLKAYKLYCQLVELNESAGDTGTHLRDFSITSPLCRKSEYTGSGDSRFCYLRLWFAATNPDALYMPVMEQDSNGNWYLGFVEKELWKPTLLEREIMQLIGE